MGISERMIAVVGAGLLLAAGGCSRGEEKAQAVASPVEQPVAAGAAVRESEVPGVALVALSDLPRSPESGAVDEACEGYRAKGLTATGEAVAARGKVVVSEARLGRYRVVSFVSGFDPGTSAICFGRNGNVGVFDGTRLVALAYDTSAESASFGSNRTAGRLEPMDNGALLVWGDSPGSPLGELHLGQDGLRLTPTAAERSFCQRKVVVPNVYDKPIQTARRALLARGWEPVPMEEEGTPYDGTADLTRSGVVEVQSCSGTGVGYCAFKYRGPGGVLDVTTVGGPEEDGNTVVSYAVACRGD